MAIRLLSIIKENKIPNICLLYGSEDYLLRQYKKRLVNAILPEVNTMNFSKFVNLTGKKDESEAMFDEIFSLSRTLPFMCDKKVILCENTLFFKNKFEDVKELLEGLPESTYLIFVEKEVAANTTAFKTAARLGFCEEYKMPDDSDLVSWIKARVKSDNKTIDSDAAAEFLTRTKTNMDNMDKELNKLLSYCMEADKITIADVRAICIVSLEEQIFNIVNAVSKKDKQAAMKEYSYLYSLKTSPRYILSLLTNKFAQILEIKRAMNLGMDRPSIAKSLGIKKEYALKMNIETANKFKESSLIYIVEMSADYQQKMNTGLLSEQTGIEMFILNALKA